MKLKGLVAVVVLLIVYTSATKTNNTSASNKFVATHEWQEIEEGQGIPRGLHVRINLETGKKEAKLLEEDEEPNEGDVSSNENSLSIMPEDFNEESKKGSSKHRIKLSEKLEAALKNLPKDLPSVEYSPEEIEEIRKKYGSYDELKKTFADLKDHFKTDAEIITKLLKEYRNLTKGDNHKSSASSRYPAEHKILAQRHILEDFGHLLHQYDNALWFIDSKGLEDILLPLIVNETNVHLRIEAMKVLGALSQNNPKAQVKVFEANFGAHLSQILLTSTHSEELSAALYALGGLVRKFPYAQQKIFSTAGSQALVSVLSKECDLKVKAKAATLISDVITEQSLELSNVKANDEHKSEIQYRELHFDLWLQTHSFCEAMDTVITANFYNFLEQPDLLEYFLQCLTTTKNICIYLWSQSPQMRHALMTVKNRYKKSEDDYRQELSEQLKDLIKSMYLHEEL